MTSFTRLGFAFALAWLLATPSWAQLEPGRLVGTVTDDQGGVLPGVTVTATSPALIGEKTVVSENDGRYRIIALPPGRYTLNFDLSGFQVLRREGIALAAGQTLTVNVKLALATMEETVTVSGRSPVVDLESTQMGTEISAEALQGVATAVDIWAAIAVAPGVRMTSYDVGGSNKSQQGTWEGYGLRGENRVITEGVDHTEGRTGAGAYPMFFATEQFTITAAGADVEMANAGVAVVSTVKSGGNNFSGLYNISYEHERMISSNVDEEGRARGYTGNNNLMFADFHADLGGPIMRDKAWFYGGYNYFRIDRKVSGIPIDQGTDLGTFHNALGKVTMKAGNNTIVLYGQQAHKWKPFRDLSPAIPAESVRPQGKTPMWQYKAEHQRIWSDRIFTELRMSHSGFSLPRGTRADPSLRPPRIDSATNIRSGAAWDPNQFIRHQPQAHARLSYYLPAAGGSHDLKVGYSYRNDQVRFGLNGKGGIVRYLDFNGQVDQITLADLNTPESFGDTWTGDDNRNMTHSLFLQDRWKPTNNWTLTLGLRYDRQRPHYQETVRNPILTDLFPAQTIPAATILTDNQIAPRLGVAYDLGGRGTTALKAFWGRFYANYADRFRDANPGSEFTKTFQFIDENGNRLYDGTHELGTLRDQSGGSAVRLGPNFKSPYADEISLSVEHQFWGEAAARMSYVRKTTKHEFGSINAAREGQFTVPASVTVPIRDFGGPVLSNERFEVMTIPASLVGVIDNVITNFPDGGYSYDTLQFGFNKRLAGGLFFQGSFDYQWRDELRSVNQSSDPLFSDPLQVGYFQNVRPDVGNRQQSTNWGSRVMGRYEFPGDFGVGVNFRVQSGFQYARTIAASVPNLGTQVFFYEDISNNRSDAVPVLDLRIEKGFTFERYKLRLMLDFFNAMNANSETNLFLRNGSTFNRIIATLDPRTAMVAARFQF